MNQDEILESIRNHLQNITTRLEALEIQNNLSGEELTRNLLLVRLAPSTELTITPPFRSALEIELRLSTDTKTNTGKKAQSLKSPKRGHFSS